MLQMTHLKTNQSLIWKQSKVIFENRAKIYLKTIYHWHSKILASVQPDIIHSCKNNMHIIHLAHNYPFVDWRPTAEMPTLQQDTHNQRWSDVPHPLAYWYVYSYCITLVLVCTVLVQVCETLMFVWILEHSLTYLHFLSLLQVRNLTLVTCAARALLLQATTTIISGATAAKSLTGDHVSHLSFDSCFCILKEMMPRCDFCGKMYTASGSLRLHLKSHLSRLAANAFNTINSFPQGPLPQRWSWFIFLKKLNFACSSGTHFNRTV